MSEICYGIISEMPSDNLLAQMKEEVHKLSEHIGIDVSWHVEYPEPIMTEEMIRNDSIFELTMNGDAETLLNPDWCQYNGGYSKEPFVARMKKIQSVLYLTLQYVPSVDLFIGDDGGLSDDYEYINASCSQIIHTLAELFEKYKSTPPVCLHVTNEGLAM